VLTGRRLGIALCVVALVVWPFVSSKTVNFYNVLAAVYALVALSLIILVGWTGQISLGHAAFLGFGVYVGQKLLAHGVPVLISVVLVAAFGAVISLALGIPSLRLRGVYLTIATLAFGAACQRYFFVLNSVRGYHASVVRRPPIFGLSISSNRGLYLLVLAVFGVGVLIAANLRRTDPGRALFAIRDSEDAAQAMAIRIAPYKIAAFALSAALATVAGLFYGMLYQATPGADQFGVLQSLFFLAMPVLGGMESLLGAVLGGIFLATAQPLANEFHIRPFFMASVALILVLLSGYDGVTGMALAVIRAVQKAAGRRADVRYGSFVPDEEAAAGLNGRAHVPVTVAGPVPDGTVVRVRLVRR
jgi:branched-chain amino acid transport system permease protein